MSINFKISDEEIIDFLIADERTRTVFYPGQITEKELKELKKIPLNECSDKNRGLFRECILKYADFYEKRFDKLVTELEDFEKLQKTDPKYRDHICHLFRVWIMGRILYRKFFHKFFDAVNTDPYFSRNELFEFVWCLCAAYHDIGYPSQTSATKHGKISAESLARELNAKFIGNWTKQALYAVRAIEHHDNKKISINIENEPYSALLIICDELQEFGRKINANDKRCEIDTLTFSIPNSEDEMIIELLYPRKQPVPINQVYSVTDEFETQLNKNFSNRITNFKINARCKVHPT